MLFASDGGNDGDGYDDDIVYEDPPEPARRTPGAQRGGGSGSGSGGGGRGGNGGGRPRAVQYQPEERYWTEYLRIALPIIGLLLMIGLLWFWALQLTSDDDAGGDDPVVTEQVATEPDVPDASPTAEPTEEVIAPPTPTPTEESTPDVPDEEPTTEPAGGELAVGASVIVTENGVNMRDDATTSANIATQLNSGDVLEITGGPFEADNYVWWEVVVEETSAIGYVVQDFIEVAP